MSTKTRLTKAAREAIDTYGFKHITGGFDRAKEAKQLAVMVGETNAAIRAKYPEADMAVLRRYKLERHDHCLKFQMPSGRVDGFSFRTDAGIVDLPYTRGCGYSSGDVFPVTAKFEAAFDAHAKLKAENDKVVSQRVAEFRGFLAACKTVEDVQQVIPLPEDLRKRIGQGSTALVAVTPETVKSLKAAFKKAPTGEVVA